MQCNTDNVIYMDNNATTRVAPEVVDAMMPFFRDRWGNPSSIHRFGGSVKREVEMAREKVAKLIGASVEEVFFTNGKRLMQRFTPLLI